METIINEEGTTEIKKGRKYYHIADNDIPGGIHTDRTAELGKAFSEKDFSVFFSIIERGIDRMNRGYHTTSDRYIMSVEHHKENRKTTEEVLEKIFQGKKEVIFK